MRSVKKWAGKNNTKELIKMTWIENEMEKIEKEDEERKKDYLETLLLKVGSNKMILDLTKEPREIKTRYGLRQVLTVIVDGQERSLFLHPIGYKDLVKKLSTSEVKGEQVNLEIIRSGTGKDDTRYEYIVG